MQTIEQALAKLKRSRFRGRFRLTKAQKEYVSKKGTELIRKHAGEIIEKRLAPAEPDNDGRQTPMHGHPVFIAQHACACCCRGCLEKWYGVPQHRQLTESQQTKIVNLIMSWIEREMEDDRLS